MVEASADALAAAKREVREETTIDDLEFRWGGATSKPRLFENKVARYYVGTATEEIKLRVIP